MAAHLMQSRIRDIGLAWLAHLMQPRIMDIGLAWFNFRGRVGTGGSICPP